MSVLLQTVWNHNEQRARPQEGLLLYMNKTLP
jgi:hypothetical protein